MQNIEDIRKEFPILDTLIYNKPLVYLDNAATTQKPKCVIDTISDVYTTMNSNVHRGVHHLSQVATTAMENSREIVREFIGAAHSHEIIFTRGTTESINLVASSFGGTFLKEGDEIIISTMEHHSNIVPWQLLQARIGIKIRVVPLTGNCKFDIEAYKGLFNGNTRLVSIAHVSNVLGSTNPIKEIIDIAHSHDVPVLVDGAQSIPHKKIDIQEFDADFFAFSGHKVYGPTGVGVLYGKEEWLDKLPPYQGGGEMIQSVSFEKTTFNELPFKFEAGTPDYIATTGLAQAIDYVGQLGMDSIEAHERDLAQYAVSRLQQIPGMHLYGPMAYGAEGAGPLSFNVEGIHHLDMGTLLDRLGVAVRTGHHCAEPVMARYGTNGVVRASIALYTNKEDIDAFIKALKRAVAMLKNF